jgi:hypothetical protein
VKNKVAQIAFGWLLLADLPFLVGGSRMRWTGSSERVKTIGG